jgi:ATP-dependent Clp protease ATP-binding subunit ClpB
MDPNKFTAKTIECLNKAQELAQDNSHQLLSPIHAAIVLFEDPEGIAKQAVLRNASEETLRSILRLLKKKLVKLPAIDPPPDQVRT